MGALQQRAEAAAERFAQRARKPLVIEFAGVPKAGKTSTLGALQSFLKRCGFRVEIVVERASVCPIKDKKHSNFNVWTASTTLAQILEKTQEPPRPDDPHILILDRGLFDSISWLSMMERLARIRKAERETIESFLLIDDWRKRINAVILMTASPEDAMEREKGLLPVEGASGSIMNPEVLEQMRANALATAERLKDQFRVFHVDTSSQDKRNKQHRTCEAVAEIALDLIEEQLQENILFLPRADIEGIFQARSSMPAENARIVCDLFESQGRFSPRDLVEADASAVQALPVVVVRNQSGEVLRLRRKEKTEDSPLHKKIVLWAGGHAREEDRGDTNQGTLVRSAVRELQEELRLNVESESIVLLGAVYVRGTDKLAKHVAIVYEWRAASNDVAVALSSAEFFERRGTSLSGSFAPLGELERDVESGELGEPWSAEIVREFLAPTGLTPRFL